MIEIERKYLVTSLAFKDEAHTQRAATNRVLFGDKNREKEHLKKAYKRALGVQTASDKMDDRNEDYQHNEELNLEDYSLEDLQDFMMSEDFEQLDELSKKTLGSYIKKASSQAGDAKTWAGYAAAGAKDAMDKGNSGAYKMHTKDYKDSKSIINKRTAGVGKAVNKLTKEQVEEIELLATKHGLSEAVIEESAELSRGAKNALAQAANHKSGSEEYHKWMAVHHSHAARSGKQADQAHHSIEAEHHFNHVPADSKSGEDFHNGDSHHWNV